MVSFDDISNKPVKFTVFGSTSVMADGYKLSIYYTTPSWYNNVPSIDVHVLMQHVF